jgi:hypothetical protein
VRVHVRERDNTIGGSEQAPAVFMGNLKQALLKADSDATLK